MGRHPFVRYVQLQYDIVTFTGLYNELYLVEVTVKGDDLFGLFLQ